MEPDHLGKYEIKGVLGKGAMGTVYEGYDPDITRRVAIKTVVLPDQDDSETSEDLARFRREAQAAGRLTHPNIVGVYDYGETGRLAFIVMEFIEGITLKPALDKHERFVIADVIRIVGALLDGLAYSHENGVIHRDIKPANVMLTHDRKIKLTDFGVARIESSSLTQAGTMIGTPSYMSPEQFTGHPADARTDLYAVGVLLYQLLTGEKPFEGGISAIMHKVLNVEPALPSMLVPAVSAALDAVVLKAMAKQPEDRFQTAAAFAAALREAAPAEEAVSPAAADAPPEPHPPETPPPPAAPPAEIMTAKRQAAPSVSAPSAAAPTRRRGEIRIAGAIIGAAALALAFAVNGLLRWQSPGQLPGEPVFSAPVAGRPLVFSLNRIRTRLRTAIAPVSCALLRGDVTAQAADLGGIIGNPQIKTLQAALHKLPVPVHFKLSGFSGPYCPALDTIRPYTALFAPAPGRLELGLINGATRLANGQLIMPQLRVPAYRSYLEVDYFTHGGAVFHLYPTPTDPPAVHPASAIVMLGNPQTGAAGWAVGPPYGRDMILAIATTVPLFQADRLQTEPDDAYLRALREGLRQVRAARGKIAVAALLLKTVPAADAAPVNFTISRAATETLLQPPPQNGQAAPAR